MNVFIDELMNSCRRGGAAALQVVKFEITQTIMASEEKTGCWGFLRYVAQAC